jgi:putative ABC transport system permease protein
VIARLRRFASKLRGLLAGGRQGREFDVELEAHLSLLADRFVRDGMTPADARAAARRQFGNVTSLREVRAEMQTFAAVTTVVQDLRHGARLLARSPGWTAVAVLTLTLGIGANVAIFSLIHPILLKPLPYADADRLVVPATIFTRYKTDRGSVAWADIVDWKAERDLFHTVAAYSPSTADITDGEAPERVRSLFVDDSYFGLMGTPPLLGRFFTPEENLPNGPPVVVLGHGLWMRRFGGTPNVIGSRLEIRGVAHTILGVARPESTWPGDAEIFRPLGTGGPPDADMLRRDNHVYQALARLEPGVSIEGAQARLTVMGARIAAREVNRAGTNWKLHSLASYIVGPALRQTLIVLFGAVLFVLLIACVNVTNLLLARGAAREREVAIRAALGAGWARIAGQFLAESALLSVAGGLAGTCAGYWGLRTLVRFAPPDIPRIEQAQVDGTVLGFAAGLCVVTTLLAGLAPALRAARVAPARSFHEGGRGASGGLRAGRLRSLLVVSELALAIILLTGAGLLIRSFSQIQRVDPGVASHNLLTLQTSLPRARYAAGSPVTDGFERLTAALRRVPGVAAASATSSLPLGGGGSYLGRVFLREGQPEPPASTDASGAWSVVQPEYFETMGIPILEGRAFTPHDAATSTPVVIISRAMAKEMFPHGSALGRRIRSWRDENLYREIVGVAGDLRYNGLTADIPNNVYVPHTQNPWVSLALVVRTSGDPNSSLKAIRAAIWSVDKKLPVAEVRTLEQVMDRDMARPRFSMFLLGIFGATAVVLAAIGIYGVIAYAVTQRTREIGIRMALGAARGRVVGMVAWNAVRLAAAGVACGLAGAFGLTRLIGSLLFEVSPTDQRTFAASAVLLLLVALAAACVPAMRAARVDPVTTLRCE